MSMEIHVLFRGKLPSKAALQSALRELGFPFSIKPATGSLERQNGFMPMLLNREETGAEFDVFEGRAAVEEIGGKEVDPRFDRIANFRWGGSMHECASAVCSAAALAKLVSGVVFDDEEGKLFSIDQAIAVARQVIAEVPKPSSPTLRPRRPSLKRLLKPLLDTRSDLVLLGRLLVIRPVRHLLRGAALHWMPKYSAFHVYRVVRPLFQATGIQEHGPAFTVWTGYLDVQGMLLDGLAGDVFPQLSRIASIDDLLDEMRARRYRPEFLRTPILLSGGNEQAEEYVAAWEKENQLPGQRANETPVKYEQEREQVFAECHAEEADRVRRFKLDSVWEPSPFPGERPRSGGAAHSSDPAFPLTPWPDYSTSWRHDPPQQQGETCFVMSWLRRCGKIFLLMPLTREEAERRHRNYIPYVLAVRLTEGPLMILYTYTSDEVIREPDESIREGHPKPRRTYRIQVYGSHDQLIRSEFHEEIDQPGIVRMWNADVCRLDERGEHSLWYSFLSVDDDEKTIHDRRSGTKIYSKRPMTDADRFTYSFPDPMFGEFDPFWNRISTYLTNEGFGTFD